MRSEEEIKWKLFHHTEAEDATFCCDIHAERNAYGIELLEWVLGDKGDDNE